MAQRGVVVIKDVGAWQQSGEVSVVATFIGFQHPDEQFGINPHMDASLLSNSALKQACKDWIVDWYTNNQSANYDNWDTTPITGDTFALVGGII